MSKRTRIHPVQFYLNDDEQYILEEKYRLSRMKSKSAFLRKMILYGFVYEVDSPVLFLFPEMISEDPGSYLRIVGLHPEIIRRIQ